MPTTLYFTNAAPAVSPSAGTKQTALPNVHLYNAEASSGTEKSLSTTAGAGTPASLAISVNSRATAFVTATPTTAQAHFLGRYSSPQLATQDLPAQQWNLFVAVGCGASAAGTISRHVLYIWRPSTQAVVQFLALTTGQPLDGSNSQGNVGWYASVNPELTNNKKQIPALTGVIQNGDIIVYEVWGYGEQSMASAYAQGMRLNAADSRIEITTSTLQYYTPPVGPVADMADTEDPDTISSDATLGPVPLNATAAMTEAAGTLSSTASVVWNPVFSTVARTEANDTSSSTVIMVPVINGGATEGNESLASTVKVTAGATATLTEAAQTVSSTASVVWPPVIANVTLTEGAESVSATAKVDVVANSAMTEDASTLVSGVAVVSPAIADLGITEADESVSSDVTVVAIPAAIASVATTEGNDALAATAAVAWPLIETLQEDFELPLDAAKWTPTAVGGTVTFSGGTSVQTISSAVFGNEATIVSKGHYTFLGSSLFWRFVQPIRSPAAGIQNGMGVKTPTGGRTIQWYLDTDGALKVVKQDNFVMTVFATVEPAYYTNPGPYAWLRVREKAGVTYFDAAPITASNPPIEADWVNKYSLATNTIAGPWTDTQANFYAYMALASAGVPTQPFKVDGVNTFANAAPGTSNANLGVTEANGTLASTATVAWPPVGATLAVTEANDTVAATSVNPRSASLAVTEANDTVASGATVVWPPVGATLAVTEANDTLAATSVNPRSASLAVTETNDTIFASAISVFSDINVFSVTTELADTVASAVTSPVTANLSVTEANDTVLGIESTTVSASLVLTEVNDTLVATVGILTPAANATLAVTEANDVVASSAAGIAGGSLARTEANDSLASSTRVLAVANLVKTEIDDTLSSIARVATVANLSVQEGADTLSSSAVVFAQSTGTLAVQEGADQVTSSASVAFTVALANLSVTEEADFTYGYAVKPKKRVILVT